MLFAKGLGQQCLSVALGVARALPVITILVALRTADPVGKIW